MKNRATDREGQRWLEQARRDLSDAEYNAHGGRHNLACFLCQQVAGKAIEAYLRASGSERRHRPSVADLCDEAASLDPAFRDVRPRVAPLDQHYLLARYPDVLPGGLPADAFTAHDSAQAIEMARLTLDFVAGRIAAP